MKALRLALVLSVALVGAASRLAGARHPARASEKALAFRAISPASARPSAPRLPAAVPPTKREAAAPPATTPILGAEIGRGKDRAESGAAAFGSVDPLAFERLVREHFRLELELRERERAETTGSGLPPLSVFELASLGCRRDQLAKAIEQALDAPGRVELPIVHPRAAPEDLERYYARDLLEDLAVEHWRLARATRAEIRRLQDERWRAGLYEAREFDSRAIT